MASHRIILGVTGSIAAYKAADLIRGFQDQDCDVTVLMTREAGEFIAPLTLSSLSGHPVLGALFASDDSQAYIRHIELARQADALVIAPATANILGKCAAGLADDLLTCTVLATRAPVFAAPAMNSRMYTNSVVQENIQKLKKAGWHVIDPVEGKLACGDIGPGHLAEPEEIVQSVLQVIER